MNKKAKISLFFIILFGLFLRVLNIGKHSLWCDELLAVSIGKHSVKWIIDYITYNDAHPPLFYIFVHYFIRFKEDEVFLRTLPLFFGILCIPLSYIFGKKFKDEKTGLLFSTLVAINPALILWSQILKSYTFFTFLTLISFILFLTLLEKDKKTKWIIFFILTNSLLLYIHNFGFIVILIQFFILLVLKKFDYNFSLSYLATFFIYIPWLIKIPNQILFTLGVKRPLPLILRFPYTLFYFFLGETLNPFNFKIVIPVFILYLLIFGNGFKNIFSLNKEKMFFLLISLFLPLIFVCFPSTVPQNLIPFSIFWLLIFSLVLESLNKKNVLLYFAFFSFFPSLFFYYTDNISQHQDTSKLIPYREIYREVKEFEKEDDLILTTEKVDEDIFAPIQWYYKGKNEIFGIKNEKDLENIANLLNKKRRVFLILDFINSPILSEKAKEFFKKNYRKIFEKKYVYNEKLLERLKGKRKFYYLVEVYLFKKK
ncbi:MAG: glycosyltransferase family 39 protein [Candidatus Ratteibacteria bacterium]